MNFEKELLFEKSLIFEARAEFFSARSIGLFVVWNQGLDLLVPLVKFWR